MWAERKGYEAVGSVLIAVRQRAGLTQAQVAKRLRKPQSFVSNYESGQRRIDVVELLKIVEALDGDPRTVFNAILRLLKPKSGRW